MNAIITHGGKVEREIRHYRFIKPKKVEIDRKIWIIDSAKDELYDDEENGNGYDPDEGE